jgi:hypothetical protein
MSNKNQIPSSGKPDGSFTVVDFKDPEFPAGHDESSKFAPKTPKSPYFTISYMVPPFPWAARKILVNS